jgi:hypothetical protein
MNTTIEISCVVTRKVTVTVSATDELVQIETHDGISVIKWDDVPSLIKAIQTCRMQRLSERRLEGKAP